MTLKTVQQLVDSKYQEYTKWLPMPMNSKMMDAKIYVDNLLSFRNDVWRLEGIKKLPPEQVNSIIEKVKMRYSERVGVKEG